MKKKLEADLISIAHRVLQLKNKSDINQLYLETQKLYEKLAVLRFVEDHFSEAKPTIGYSEISKEIESVFENPSLESESIHAIEENPIEENAEVEIEKEVENAIQENNEVVLEKQEEKTSLSSENPTEELPSIEVIEETENITEESEENTFETTEEETINEAVEETEEETKTEVTQENAAPIITESENTPFVPAFEMSPVEEVETELETPKKSDVVQISFEELLGGNYHDTLFVKKDQVQNTAAVIETPIPAEEKKTAVLKTNIIEAEVAEQSEPKTVSLNDKLSKGINIDLNDRLAFIKHLFGNSSEDYNRVLSQLITFNTFYETRDFVQEMVKPDYNNWDGKQEYEDRFMDIIEKKFL